MKSIKLLAFLFIATLVFTGCSDDDVPELPDLINEEEVITTMTITLTPVGGGTAVTLQTRDLDGDGPNAPVVTMGSVLAENTTYTGSIVLLNETETPAEDITEEIEEEDEEHQFFFVATGVNGTFAYTDTDENGNPVGLNFTLTTTTASTGSLTFILKHEPTKPNNGSATDAGGETDIETTFDVTIQ